MNFNQEVTDYISKAKEEQIILLESIRQLIHEAVPGTTEAIKWRMPVFAKTKDYAYLRFSKNHLTFGFYNSERIVDTNNLLEGTGKSMKHIKIRNKDDIDDSLISEWLKLISE